MITWAWAAELSQRGKDFYCHPAIGYVAEDIVGFSYVMWLIGIHWTRRNRSSDELVFVSLFLTFFGLFFVQCVLTVMGRIIWAKTHFWLFSLNCFFFFYFIHLQGHPDVINTLTWMLSRGISVLCCTCVHLWFVAFFVSLMAQWCQCWDQLIETLKNINAPQKWAIYFCSHIINKPWSLSCQ